MGLKPGDPGETSRLPGDVLGLGSDQDRNDRFVVERHWGQWLAGWDGD